MVLIIYVFFLRVLFIFLFLGTKLRLYSNARKRRTCFCAEDLVVQRENTRLVFLLETRKQFFLGTFLTK